MASKYRTIFSNNNNNTILYSIRSSSRDSWFNRLIRQSSFSNNNNNNNDTLIKDESQSECDKENVDGSGQMEETHPQSDYKKLLVEKDELLTIKDNEIQTLKDKYARSLADTENTRTYMKKQVHDSKLYAIQEFSKDILSVADVLEKALESCQSTTTSTTAGVNNDIIHTLIDGLQMIDTELIKIFNKHGLERIDPSIGDTFDTNYHEALFTIPTGDKPGTVGVVNKVGYTLNGRTIRPALVGVISKQ